MKLLIYILITYGASNIVVFSTIFEGIRKWLKKNSPNFLGELINCMICFPFWFGVLLSIIIYSPSIEMLGVRGGIILGAFLDGCLASGSVWLIHTIQESIEKNE